METLYWQYPETAGDLPFGTVVQRNVLANLHDHLSGALSSLLLLLQSSGCRRCWRRPHLLCRCCHVCRQLHAGCEVRSAAGWKVDLDVLGTNNTFVQQARPLAQQGRLNVTHTCSSLAVLQSSCVADLRVAWRPFSDLLRGCQTARPVRDRSSTYHLASLCVGTQR